MKLPIEIKPIKYTIPFRPRLKLFKGCNGKLTFDPATGLGLSYSNGYQITAVIDGQMVLNSYDYSVTTSGHVETLRTLFTQLEVKYREIWAPTGLRRLEMALPKHCTELARLELAAKTSRVRSYTDAIAFHKECIRWLKKHLPKTEQKPSLMKECRASAMFERQTKLKAKAKERVRKNIQFTTIFDNSPDLMLNAIGIHNFRADGPNHYDCETLRDHATKCGLKQVYIHLEASRAVCRKLGTLGDESKSLIILANGERIKL